MAAEASAPRPRLRDITATPNLVSLARVALTPVVIALLVGGHRLWAVATLVVLFATDGLDGWIARRTSSVTELGKILDPVADKIAVGAVLIYLVAAGEFPLWALLLVVGRDIAIAVGGAAIARKSGEVPSALMVGKLALVALAVVTVVFAGDFTAFETAALALCVLAVLASGMGYAAVAWRALKGPGERAA